MSKLVNKAKRALHGAKRRVKSSAHRVRFKIKSHIGEAKLVKLDTEAGRSLKVIQDNTGLIKKNSIILFCCLRNEKSRMPFFFDYYRKIGVDHFIIVDNNSDDGLMSVCEDQSDVTVFHTSASYKDAKFGMLWLNYLLAQYGVDHWNVVVDADEFLVYPYMETRSLKSLASYLDEEGRICFHAIMLDTYSDKPLSETKLAEGQDPFLVCPYFDKDGYIQTGGWGGGTWIRGGPRMRVYFNQRPHMSPSLNKIPFVKWQKNYHYNMSMHDAFPFKLNNAHDHGKVNPTGALFHFKMVSTLVDKAQEEMERKEHYGDGVEYKMYNENASPEFYKPGISVRYENDSQLIKLGLISPGTWF